MERTDVDVNNASTFLDLQDELAACGNWMAPPDFGSIDCLTGLPEGEEVQDPPEGG